MENSAEAAKAFAAGNSPVYVGCSCTCLTAIAEMAHDELESIRATPGTSHPVVHSLPVTLSNHTILAGQP